MEMITIMNNQVEKCLDPQLWHACAGGMVQMPQLNSKVFFFPQGHAEHAQGNVDFSRFTRVPPLIPCKVAGIKYMADTETDEVYAKVKLSPLKTNGCDLDDDSYLGFDKNENEDKPASFAKTLTQSDANNGGGFSVPRYCAETIFPKLDYSAEPPVQTILAKDVHGQVWKFRHIYRGTPRRHLLTTGWSNFVNHKKLVAGDSIVFLRTEHGELCVGVRRAKRGNGGSDLSTGWNNSYGNNSCYAYGGLKNPNGVSKTTGKLSGESVVEAVSLAANNQTFEVVYYPRAGTPEFFVKAATVTAAMRVQWCSGMRFKMAFETEDSSRISWFMGTISSVQVEDPMNWPNSPWRLLQVTWDEPDLLQNVKRVSPWLVELVSNIPAIHLSPFSPPRKKMRVPQPPDFPLMAQIPMPTFLNSIPQGIQGARHGSYSSNTPPNYFNSLHSGLLPFGFPHHMDYPSRPNANPPFQFTNSPRNSETALKDVSCLLTMGTPKTGKTYGVAKKEPAFLLFGQPILTQQQLSQSSSDDSSRNSFSGEKTANLSDGMGSGVVQAGPVTDSSSDEGFPWYKEASSVKNVCNT